MDDIRIVDIREGASMASSWKEYLCVRPLGHDLYELSVRMYECLGEYNDYADEEGNIPDLIDGKTVMSVDDGYICGGSLLYMNEDSNDVVAFRHASAPEVDEWLKSKRWSRAGITDLITKAISN